MSNCAPGPQENLTKSSPSSSPLLETRNDISSSANNASKYAYDLIPLVIANYITDGGYNVWDRSEDIANKAIDDRTTRLVVRLANQTESTGLSVYQRRGIRATRLRKKAVNTETDEVERILTSML
jgi:hypothetical protein